MPYTLPLDPPPSLPSPQAKIVNADGTPSREMVTWMVATQEANERFYKALQELEPP